MNSLQAAVAQPSLSRKERRLAKKRARKNSAVGAPVIVGDKALEALWEKARRHLAAENEEAAEAAIRELAVRRPDLPNFRYALAEILMKQARTQEAYVLLKDAVSLAPDNAHYWDRFGHCLGTLGLVDAAIVAYRNAVSRAPENADYQLHLANMLSNANDADAAIEAFDAAIAIDPNLHRAHFGKGNQLEVLGNFEAARQCYERTLEIDPDFFEVHLRLAETNQLDGDTDAVIAKLEGALESTTMTDETRSRVLFAAAKMRQSEKDYDGAFAYYLRANDVMKDVFPCDRDAMRVSFDQLIDAFTSEAFDAHRNSGVASDVPVFVVGMPRSGTTLTEQILSSHPDVAGVGELRKMDQTAGTLAAIKDGELRYPRDISKIAAEGLVPLGEEYLAELTAKAGADARRIVDKYVFNFLNLGLIAILFPKASIIYCKRDPMDCGLSIFFQNFTAAMSNPFWFDLEEIGLFYREHERLMEHWTSVLPIPIHEVVYEELVADQEAVSRGMIEFIGLDWDDACLDFHRNERTVNTASVWQVRQPVYKTSAGRWRRYERHLDPLKRGLGLDS